MITASFLYAQDKHRPGSNRCFFCGIDCDESFRVKDHVKNTFTNFDEVICPGSKFVCGCCVESMSGLATTTDIDGETREGRAGAPRMYSWVMTDGFKTAFNKKRLDYARASIISPPKPPFVIVLADSGQKQLIFRAPVNHERETFCVMLEDKRIEVRMNEIGSYITRATMAAAAIGKKALSNPNTVGCYIAAVEFWGTEKHLEDWIEIHTTPMGQLAAWLCKGRDDARNDECVCGRVPEKIGVRVDNATTESGQRKHETTGHQLLFDFAAPVQR